jgi:hypothetical protein
MLIAVFILLMLVWLVGVAASYTLYGFIHVLVVFAIGALAARALQGRTVS